MKPYLSLLACLLLGAAVCADDFKLKDGSKISGTIVGFDDSSFKVQTSYGFALVRKDQVVSISISDSGRPAAEKKSESPQSDKPLASIAKKEEKAAEKTTKQDAASTLTTAPASTPPATSLADASAAQSTSSAAVPVAPPVAAPSEPVRESVDGNFYTNETYGFRMYKPPAWKVIEGARSLMPGAIAAMGTLDETTYLLIGQQPVGKSLTTEIDTTDRRLHEMLTNFRPLGETRVNVSGGQAIERRFRGSVDEKDWSGTVAFVTHGGQLYTIFGMTIADSDLVQIQENVIARAITSLQFTP